MTSRIVRWYHDLRLDLVAAWLGLALALALFPLRFLASQIYVKTVPLMLGGACALYLLGSYFNRTQREQPTLPTALVRSLPGVTLASLGGMVVVAALSGARTPIFHGIAALTGSAILVQILLAHGRDLNVPLVLGQIVLFAAVVRFSALYVTPGYIGIDIWTHVALTREIVSSGSLSAIADNKYVASPLYHLLLGAASMLTDLPIRSALLLTLGLVAPVSVLLVYATASHLLLRRWALLAAMLYGVCDYVIEWSLHIIPTSLGLLFYLGALYALVRVIRTAPTVRNYLLLLFMSVAVILTHQVSSFILVVTLAGAIVTQIVLALGLLDIPSSGSFVSGFTRNPVNLAGLFVFNVGLLTFMWSLTPYRGNSFLETMLSFIQETIASSAGFLSLASEESAAAGGAAGPPSLVEQAALYADTVGFLLLLFATFLGCLYVVNRRHSEQSVVTMLVITAVMLVFVMGLPMFGIRNFIPTRWFAFLYAPMAILGAIGLRFLANNLSARPVFAVLLVFALVYPGAMLVSSEATVENPVFEDHRPELAYDRAELAAANAVGEMTGAPRGDRIRPDQVLFTDHPYQTMIDRQDLHPTALVRFNDSGPAEHDLTLYRRQQSTEATFFSDNGTARIMNVPEERVCRPTQNVLYTNGDVLFCTVPD